MLFRSGLEDARGALHGGHDDVVWVFCFEMEGRRGVLDGVDVLDELVKSPGLRERCPGQRIGLGSGRTDSLRMHLCDVWDDDNLELVAILGKQLLEML